MPDPENKIAPSHHGRTNDPHAQRSVLEQATPYAQNLPRPPGTYRIQLQASPPATSQFDDTNPVNQIVALAKQGFRNCEEAERAALLTLPPRPGFWDWVKGDADSMLDAREQRRELIHAGAAVCRGATFEAAHLALAAESAKELEQHLELISQLNDTIDKLDLVIDVNAQNFCAGLRLRDALTRELGVPFDMSEETMQERERCFEREQAKKK